MNRPKLKELASSILSVAMLSSLSPAYESQATVLPSNGTDEGVPLLGDGYDSVFKDKKFGCVNSTAAKIKTVNQSVSGTLNFSSNMALDNIVNKLEFGPDFTVNRSFLNLRLRSNYMNAHSSTDTSSTFHFFWRGTGKTQTLAHDSVEAKIPSADLIRHIEGESPDHLDTLTHYRSSCGDEFVSEIHYGAYLIVTLKLVFATSSDKRQFDTEMQLKPGSVTQVVSKGGSKGGSKGSGDEASSSGQAKAGSSDPLSISGKLLDLSRKKDLRTSSVEVVINQVGGDPTWMSRMLGGKAIDGRLVLECTGSSALEKCVVGFDNAVEYTRAFLESLSGKKDLDDWVAMGYVTVPYSDVASLLGSDLSLLNSPDVISDDLLSEIDSVDIFLEDILNTERKALSLLESADNEYYAVSSKTLLEIEDIRRKASAARIDVKDLYNNCHVRISSCMRYIEKFQAKHPSPYALDIDSSYLRLIPGDGELVKDDVMIGGSGGSAFDHSSDILAPEEREVKVIEMHVSDMPSLLKTSLDDGTVLNAGFQPPRSSYHSEDVVYTDMFGVPHFIHASASSVVKKLVLDRGEFISYVEAHSKKVSGKARVSFLRICKSNNEDIPMQVCMEGGEQTEQKSHRLISSSSKVLGFHGRQGKAIDEIGLVLFKKPQLQPAL